MKAQDALRKCKLGRHVRESFIWFELIDIYFRKFVTSRMIDFYNRLKLRAQSQTERNAKADDIRRGAQEIRDALKSCHGNEFVNYYLHCAICHLPDQIRDCPVDVFDASGCALEHLHKDVKRTLL